MHAAKHLHLLSSAALTLPWDSPRREVLLVLFSRAHIQVPSRQRNALVTHKHPPHPLGAYAGAYAYRGVRLYTFPLRVRGGQGSSRQEEQHRAKACSETRMVSHAVVEYAGGGSRWHAEGRRYGYCYREHLMASDPDPNPNLMATRGVPGARLKSVSCAGIG